MNLYRFFSDLLAVGKDSLICYIVNVLYNILSLLEFHKRKKTKSEKKKGKGFYNEEVSIHSATGVGETSSLKKSNYV